MRKLTQTKEAKEFLSEITFTRLYDSYGIQRLMDEILARIPKGKATLYGRSKPLRAANYFPKFVVANGRHDEFMDEEVASIVLRVFVDQGTIPLRKYHTLLKPTPITRVVEEVRLDDMMNLARFMD
jgi:hypothetical protein